VAGIEKKDTVAGRGPSDQPFVELALDIGGGGPFSDQRFDLLGRKPSLVLNQFADRQGVFNCAGRRVDPLNLIFVDPYQQGASARFDGGCSLRLRIRTDRDQQRSQNAKNQFFHFAFSYSNQRGAAAFRPARGG
jgi:hypothetical protein